MSGRREVTTQRVGRQITNLVPIRAADPTCKPKGIQAHAGVMTDRED